MILLWKALSCFDQTNVHSNSAETDCIFDLSHQTYGKELSFSIVFIVITKSVKRLSNDSKTIFLL